MIHLFLNYVKGSSLSTNFLSNKIGIPIEITIFAYQLKETYEKNYTVRKCHTDGNGLAG